MATSVTPIAELLAADPAAGDELLPLVQGGRTKKAVLSSLLTFVLPLTGAIRRAFASKLAQRVSPKDFGAAGDGVTDDTAALQDMFGTGKPWEIDQADYLASAPLQISSDGVCHGRIIAAAGFAGRLLTICNPTFGERITIRGLTAYSTDVRPSPYDSEESIKASTGIYVGPDATHLGVTPCPGVALIGCKAKRFSIGLHVATFNVEVYSGAFQQNDHNVLVYSSDTVFNQINDVRIMNSALDSAASSVGQPYAVRIGTSGNGTYAPSIGMGYNVVVRDCNTDGAPLFLDNVIGADIKVYCEQPAGYGYTGAAIVLGTAGINTLQRVRIHSCTFNTWDIAIEAINPVLGLVIDPCSYSAVRYSAFRSNGTELSGFVYRSGTAIGSFEAPEVCTNFTGGIAPTQVTFAGVTIEGDFLQAGAQIISASASTALQNWYPYARTLDGRMHLSSALGRYHTGAAIAGPTNVHQTGSSVSFDTPSDALKYNGGDAITGANGSTIIKSIDYHSATAVVDGTVSGTVATTISHAQPFFKTTIEHANSAPASGGPYNVGDIAWNDSVTNAAGQPVGYVCVVAGSPGTWRPFGVTTN